MRGEEGREGGERREGEEVAGVKMRLYREEEERSGRGGCWR